MQELGYIARDAYIPEITKDAKHVLFHLASREGDHDASWASHRTMSMCTNISVRGVQRAIECLIEHGLVAVESGKTAGRANRYRVTLPQRIVDEWYRQNGKRRKVSHRDVPSLRQPDAPGFGQPDGAGAPKDAQGYATVTYRKETLGRKQSQSESVGPAAPTDSQTAAQAVIQKLDTGKFSVDKDHAHRIAYDLGLSKGECEAFWRYNQTRGWPLLAVMTLEDIAKAWLDKWLKAEPSGYANERDRRRQAAYEAELRAAQKRAASESQESQSTQQTPQRGKYYA